MQKNKCTRYFVAFLFWTTLNVFGLLHAQSLDESSSINLSEQEITRLKTILDQPIDPNSLKSTLIEIYKQKEVAAWRLGDEVKREELLREWAQVDPGARWILRNFLSMTPKRAEAYQIGHELIKEIKLKQVC